MNKVEAAYFKEDDLIVIIEDSLVSNTISYKK